MQILDANARSTLKVNPPASQWGTITFQQNLTLSHARTNTEVDLELINSTAAMLDWIFHLQGRLGTDVVDLIAAFQEIFNPCANCCSWGREKPFSGSDLAKAHAERIWPKGPKRKPIPTRLRYSILERAGFRCQACGITAADGAQLHVDHIHPVSKGGTNDPSNLQALCQACNSGKGAGTPSLIAAFALDAVTPAESIAILEGRWGICRNALKARARALGVDLVRKTSTLTVWPGDRIQEAELLHAHLKAGGVMATFVDSYRQTSVALSNP